MHYMNTRGDIIALVDSNSAVTNSYSYNPWGKHTTSTESGVIFSS